MAEVQTRQQYWGNFEPKQAEAAGTHVMPHGAPVGKAKVLKTIPKTAAGPEERIAPPPEGVEPAVAGEQPEQNPQTKPINPRVNVEGKEPPATPTEKKAGYFALPSLQRYPLDSFGEVEKAASYFDQYRGQFAPSHRREFCLNLVKRASALGIPLSDTIRKYGSAERAPAEEVAFAFDARKGLVTDDVHSIALSKLAESWPAIPPEILVEVLSEFDKVAGLDYLYDEQIPDPYWSVFGEKTAQDTTHVLGNEIVSDAQLRLLAKSPSQGLCDLYGKDFVQEFKEDPVGIFNSLPMDQKKVLARMANDVRSP